MKRPRKLTRKEKIALSAPAPLPEGSPTGRLPNVHVTPVWPFSSKGDAGPPYNPAVETDFGKIEARVIADFLAYSAKVL